MRLLLVVAIALACMVWTSPAVWAQADRSEASPSATHHRERGLQLMERGEFAAALEAFRAAVERDPHDAAAHDLIGVVLGETGRFDAAIPHFREAARLAPRFAEPRFHLGLALERTGRMREALLEYQEALRINPDLLEARYGLSSACAALGDLDGAIALLRQVVEKLPAFAEARYNLGLHLWNRHKTSAGPRPKEELDAAIEALQAAVGLEPGQAAYHFALGQLRAETGALAAAVQSLTAALERAPGEPEYAYNLGLALRLAADLEGAEHQFRAALDRNPEHGLARRALGLVLRDSGALQEAAAELRRSVVQLPDDAQGHHLLGTVLARLDDSGGAIGAFRRAVDLDPDLVEARVNLAQALARAGDKAGARRQQEETQRIHAGRTRVSRTLILLETAETDLAEGNVARAVEQLREAAGLSPAAPEVHYRLALALRRASADPDRVETALRKALDLDPHHAPARFHLGLLLAGNGDTDGAFRQLQLAVDSTPSFLDAQRALAEAAQALEDWATAVSALRAVLAWDPEDARMRYALGLALRRQGDAEEAAREIATARRLDPSLPPP